MRYGVINYCYVSISVWVPVCSTYGWCCHLYSYLYSVLFQRLIKSLCYRRRTARRAMSVKILSTVETSCTVTYAPRLMALCPGLPGWAGTRKVKPIWILLKQETVSGSAGSYASLHLAPDRQPHQHPTTQFFTGRMPLLPPNQQRQSTEGKSCTVNPQQIAVHVLEGYRWSTCIVNSYDSSTVV